MDCFEGASRLGLTHGMIYLGCVADSWFRQFWVRRIWRPFLARRPFLDFIGLQLVAVAAVVLLLILRAPGWAFHVWTYIALAGLIAVLFGPRDRG